MSEETAITENHFDSVVEKIEEVYENHYAEFKVSVKIETGFAEIRHDDKGNETEITILSNGDTKVDWSSASKQLSKKIEAVMGSMGGPSGGDPGPAVTDETRDRADRDSGNSDVFEERADRSPSKGTEPLDPGDITEEPEAIEPVDSLDDSLPFEDNDGGDGFEETRGEVKDSMASDAVVEGERTSFIPSFTKKRVDYDDSSGPNNEKCKNCVHYIQGGGCHVVRGEISPNGHCDKLYADIGLFASGAGREPNLNMIMWGEVYQGNISGDDVMDIVQMAREKMEERK